MNTTDKPAPRGDMDLGLVCLESYMTVDMDGKAVRVSGRRGDPVAPRSAPQTPPRRGGWYRDGWGVSLYSADGLEIGSVWNPKREGLPHRWAPVSYTHLTLPTKRIV